MPAYIDPYIEKTIRVFPEQGRGQYLRFDMNENPEGLPEEFVNSVLKEITPSFLATYPEPNRFIQKYAEYIGANPENILPTNGSDMAIRYLLETFGETGKSVVTVSPSFEMYWVNCNILGLKHVGVEYEADLSISIDKLCDAITGETRVVALVNPNNPVGNVYKEEDIDRIVTKAKTVGAIVIIDEAYHYFYSESYLNRALQCDNVVVLRTFSKLFSLAACRLGVIIGNPKLISYVRNGRLTFDVNSFALLFGERILNCPDIIEALITTEKNGKEYVYQCLDENDYKYRKCEGNYILIETKKNPMILAELLKDKHKMLVHTYKHPLLKNYMRVSIGSVEIMKVFMKAFLMEDGVNINVCGAGL